MLSTPHTPQLLASVIIVGYLDRIFVHACLSSLLDQDMPREAYEIIYGDNASPDGSGDYVEENFPEVNLLRFSKNYGFAEGNNRAAQHARGRYLVFVNLDTVAHRSWLSSMIYAMEEDPSLGACYSNQIVPGNAEYEKKDRFGQVDNVYLPVIARAGYMDVIKLPFQKEPVPTLFLSGGSFSIRREILDEMGFLFDNAYFIYAEDLDLGLRTYALGYEVALIPGSILYHDTGTSIHKPDAKPTYNFAAVKKLHSVLRNRFITYYKNMYGLEFVLFLPIMLFGAPFKAGVIKWNLARRTISFLGMIPLTVIAFFNTLLNLGKFQKTRSGILAKRKTGRFWLLRSLITRYPPLPSVEI